MSMQGAFLVLWWGTGSRVGDGVTQPPGRVKGLAEAGKSTRSQICPFQPSFVL